MRQSLIRPLVFTFLLAVSLSTSVLAHGVTDGWDADYTQVACLMGVDSDWSHESEFGTADTSEVTVRVIVVAPHPGADIPIPEIQEINPDPFFVQLQIITPHDLRIDGIEVSRVVLSLSGNDIVLDTDPDWHDKSLPIVRFGGGDAEEFVDLLSKAVSPVVKIRLTDSTEHEHSVTTKSFAIAFAMMRTCQKEASARKSN